MKYKAWGGVRALDKDTISQPWRFQGQYEDAETGLHYNRFRYYDSDSARYLTQDPIGLTGNENFYRYVTAPTSWVDPLGLTASCPTKLAVQNLPQFKGKSRAQVEKIMIGEPGWKMTKKNQTSTEYTHTDGSYVRIDAYGNKTADPRYGTANNAHVHKQAGPSQTACKFNDRGIATTNLDETHIGMRNPKDLPTVRGRPHGAGGRPKT